MSVADNWYRHLLWMMMPTRLITILLFSPVLFCFSTTLHFLCCTIDSRRSTCRSDVSSIKLHYVQLVRRGVLFIERIISPLLSSLSSFHLRLTQPIRCDEGHYHCRAPICGRIVFNRICLVRSDSHCRTGCDVLPCIRLGFANHSCTPSPLYEP